MFCLLHENTKMGEKRPRTRSWFFFQTTLMRFVSFHPMPYKNVSRPKNNIFVLWFQVVSLHSIQSFLKCKRRSICGSWCKTCFSVLTLGITGCIERRSQFLTLHQVERWLLNIQLGTVLKAVAVALFKVLSRHVHEKLITIIKNLIKVVSEAKYFRIRRQNITHSARLSVIILKQAQ